MKLKRAASLFAAIILLVLTSCAGDKDLPSNSTGQSESSETSSSTQGNAVTKKPLTAWTKADNLPAATVIGIDFAVGSLYKGPAVKYRTQGDKQTLGFWWWDIKNIITPEEGVSVDMILDCLIVSNVTEIYFCINSMLPWSEQVAQEGVVDEGMVSEADVRGFVAKCSSRGIRVAALGGASNWISVSNKGTSLYTFMDKVAEYQANAGDNEKFYGVHLDIEPHTLDDFNMKRQEYLQLLADLTITAKEYAKDMELLLEWDIYSFLEESDKVKDSKTGQEKNILDIMFTYCDSVGVMTYFNNAEAQYERGELEIEYAKKYQKKVILSSETIKIAPSQISYYVSGKDILIRESELLNSKLKDSGANYGFAIHHAVKFYELMTRDS